MARTHATVAGRVHSFRVPRGDATPCSKGNRVEPTVTVA